MASVSIAFPDEFPVRMVGLREIKVDHGVQSRCQTDAAHAAGIRDFVLKNGPISEPVVVFEDGVDLWLADGFHRVEGYRQAAKQEKRFLHIRAEVRSGSRRDALVFSAGANQDKTYLKRTKKDIERAIWMLLDLPEWRSKASGIIASHVGITPATACKYINIYRDKNNIQAPEVVEGKNGGIYPSARKPAGIPKITVKTDGGRTPAYTAFVKGKVTYLGTNKEEAERKLAEIVASEEFDSSNLTYTKLTLLFARQHLIFEALKFGVPQACLYGMVGHGCIVTWDNFEENNSSVQAIGRANCCRTFYDSAARVVVLCFPYKGVAAVLDLGRRQGIEFMSPRDFIASLKGEGEPTPEAP